MEKAYSNVLDLVGNTPLLKLNKSVPKTSHNFFAKVEFLNPGGSVKDRIAKRIIEEAEKRGELQPGSTIIEATSGNTGVGLALVAAVKGYNSIFVMPSKMSKEKVDLLRAFGSKVILTPTGVEPDDPRSHYQVAKKLVEITPKSFYANQFHNDDNPQTHYETTGPEIWEQTGGKIDVLVAGAGTGGTISGCGRYLKEKNPEIKIILADPKGSILHDLYYHKEVKKPPAPYQVEGIGEDMLPDNMHFQYVDDVIQVDDKPAFMLCRDMMKKDGIFCGPSSGAILHAAIEYGKKHEDKNLNIVSFLCDSGDRYLSKAFNDDWMKENGFLDSPLQLNTVADLIRTQAKEQELFSVNTSNTVLEVIEMLKEKGLSQLPVVDGVEVIGLVDESDLLYPLASGDIKPTDSILNFVKDNILFVDWDGKLQILTELFQKGYVALVKNPSGSVNIITKIDLIEFLGKK